MDGVQGHKFIIGCVNVSWSSIYPRVLVDAYRDSGIYVRFMYYFVLHIYVFNILVYKIVYTIYIYILVYVYTIEFHVLHTFVFCFSQFWLLFDFCFFVPCFLFCCCYSVRFRGFLIHFIRIQRSRIRPTFLWMEWEWQEWQRIINTRSK